MKILLTILTLFSISCAHNPNISSNSRTVAATNSDETHQGLVLISGDKKYALETVILSPQLNSSEKFNVHLTLSDKRQLEVVMDQDHSTKYVSLALNYADAIAFKNDALKNNLLTCRFVKNTKAELDYCVLGSLSIDNTK